MIDDVMGCLNEKSKELLKHGLCNIDNYPKEETFMQKICEERARDTAKACDEFTLNLMRKNKYFAHNMHKYYLYTKVTKEGVDMGFKARTEEEINKKPSLGQVICGLDHASRMLKDRRYDEIVILQGGDPLVNGFKLSTLCEHAFDILQNEQKKINEFKGKMKDLLEENNLIDLNE
jgi:hypothetical protein